MQVRTSPRHEQRVARSEKRVSHGDTGSRTRRTWSNRRRAGQRRWSAGRITWVSLLGGLLLFGGGCSRQPTSSEAPSPAEPQQHQESASVETRPASAPDSPSAGDRSSESSPNALAADGPGAAGANGEPTAEPSRATSPSRTPSGSPGKREASAPTPLSLADGDENRPAIDGERKLQLRSDLSPEKLREFLNAADQDMETIFRHGNSFQNAQEREAELTRIIQLKLQAARRLASHPDAGAAARTEGKRGELQALSHMASLGNLDSAEQLEKLAHEYVQSEDAKLASDSRLVLMGFAIERLQNGREGAAEEVVQLVDRIAQSSSPSDLPAMMVMGQAKQVLEQYEHPEPAQHVREKIIERFGDSPDAQVAQMAAQLAGKVKYDEIDQLRAAAVSGDEVAPDRWREAVEKLVAESPDLATVRYLAGAALELEGAGRKPLADVTYEVLAERFDDPETAPGREAQLALDAREARHGVIGRVFDPDLPTVGDAELDISDYRGQVVLIPFWDSRFPPSLQLIPKLKQLRQEHPGQVGIVGMNLDLEGTDVAGFMEEQSLDFPSYRSASSPTAEVANEVAARFGLVSMPFVVILDREGRVAAINITGKNMEQTVEQLLED